MVAIAIDTETTGPFLQHGCKPFMVTACDEKGYAFKWEFTVDPYTRDPIYDEETVTNLFDTLSKYKTWVFHNALFDIKALELLGSTNFENLIQKVVIHDTMLMAHCNDSLDKRGLKGLALLYLDYPEHDEKDLDKAVNKARRIGKRLKWAIADDTLDSLKALKDKKGKCDFWLPKAVARSSPPGTLDSKTKQYFEKVCSTYAVGDVERTIGLFIYFRKILKDKDDWKHYEKNRLCLLPTYYMQNQGFYLQRQRLPSLLHNLSQTKEDVRNGLQRLCRIKNFNPRSPIELKQALFESLNIESQSFTEKGNLATDKEAIKEILERTDINSKQEQFCRRLLTYRKLNTAQSYLDSYQRHEINSRLYSNLNPAGTSTLRYAAKNPNAQNISKQDNDDDSFDMTVSFNLREAFGPPKGKLWICIDYAQLQLRIFAHACGDSFLIDSFAKGLDIHDIVAKEVFQTEQPTSLQRRAAKAINFGIIFGAGRAKIERMSKIDGSYALFKDRFPLVDKYLKRCERYAKRNGYVRTLGGYPLRVPKKTAYKACNIVVQGTEGEMVKTAINDCTEYCSLPEVPIVPIMLIHDEIIFQTKNVITKARFLKQEIHHITKVADLMNQAANSVGVYTEVDAKITNSSWSNATSLPIPVTV